MIGKVDIFTAMSEPHLTMKCKVEKQKTVFCACKMNLHFHQKQTKVKTDKCRYTVMAKIITTRGIFKRLSPGISSPLYPLSTACLLYHPGGDRLPFQPDWAVATVSCCQ